MKGKETCKALKEIRAQIALENDIEYVTSECKHKGDCSGTCPKCEAELRYLEKELEKKKNLGKKVTFAGLSIGMMAALTGCSPDPAKFMVSPINFFRNNVAEPEMLDGDVVNPTYIDGELIAGEETYLDSECQQPEQSTSEEESEETIAIEGDIPVYSE